MSRNKIPALLRPEPKQYSIKELIAELRFHAGKYGGITNRFAEICEQAANKLETLNV